VSGAALIEEHDPIMVWVQRLRMYGEQPDPGPPWSTNAGLPEALPQTSQYRLWPSPTSSIPHSSGSMAG